MASVRMPQWICEYCGSKSSMPAFSGHCGKSPDKKHKWKQIVFKEKM